MGKGLPASFPHLPFFFFFLLFKKILFFLIN